MWKFEWRQRLNVWINAFLSFHIEGLYLGEGYNLCLNYFIQICFINSLNFHYFHSKSSDIFPMEFNNLSFALPNIHSYIYMCVYVLKPRILFFPQELHFNWKINIILIEVMCVNVIIMSMENWRIRYHISKIKRRGFDIERKWSQLIVSILNIYGELQSLHDVLSSTHG